MTLEGQARELAARITDFHNTHQPKTWNAGTPGIDPWLRDSLVALQTALYKLSEVQMATAKQVDENTENINRVFRYINSQK